MCSLNIFNKKVFSLLLLLIVIASISVASANELNQTTETFPQSQNSTVYEDSLNDMQTARTFSDLNSEINSNDNSEIYLKHNYTFNSDFDEEFKKGIVIDRAITVWGNGFTLDGNNSARIFNVANSNVVFHDINFINGNTADNGGAINGKCSAANCNFTRNTAGFGGAVTGADCVNCRFTQNSANYRGGASCGGSFENCIFTGNFAYHEGGAYYLGSNMKIYSITNCSFTENSANEGGAISIQFPEYCRVVDCTFTANTASWIAGAVNSVICENCTFIENSADYGGAMRYGWAINCIFLGNSAIFGGASFEGGCRNSTFIENYADYGGAIYNGFRTENCMFIENHADYGGAIHGNSLTVETCYFANNTARDGGAAYQIEVKNSYFEGNSASGMGGAMYGESAINCVFKNNSRTDTYNTEITQSDANISQDINIIYFDASAERDGNGSKKNPYKYLYAERITPGVTAYFAQGTYELESTCTISQAKLIGTGRAVISSKVSDKYDFIIRQNSYLEMYNLILNNVNILNQATLKADTCSFEGNDVFDPQNLPEIESGSGLFDSSYGGIIVCDPPGNVKSTLILNGCYFQRVYDAFNGGVIAAINSNISISNTVFMHYSATYKGGAIYCLNSNLNIQTCNFQHIPVQVMMMLP